MSQVDEIRKMLREEGQPQAKAPLVTTYIRAALEGNESLLDGPEHDDYCALSLNGGRVFGLVHAFHGHSLKGIGAPPDESGHASLDLHGLSLAQLRAVLAALRAAT